MSAPRGKVIWEGWDWRLVGESLLALAACLVVWWVTMTVGGSGHD